VTGQDEDAIRAVLADIYAALAAGDADAYAAHYAEHATVLTPGQAHWGREALRKTLAEWLSGPLRGARGVYEPAKMWMVGTDAAVVISRSSVLLAGQTEVSPTDEFIDTWVFGRTPDGWLVEAFHSCPEHAP
jgi:uncharacterized protein (TIGR02246 family)